MLHTIIDISQVLNPEQQITQSVKYKRYGSGFVEYTVQSGKIKPRRLHSTNPADYLSYDKDFY